MKLSIITPSLNQGVFLETAILSVLQQKYPNLEYIIVDGKSTDCSISIIKKYKGAIHRWISEKDSGQSEAINKGFKMSTGEIVAWINSDDFYFPGAFCKAIGEFEKNPCLVLLYGNCAFVSEKGEFIRYFSDIQRYDPLILRDFSDYIMQPATFFRRRQLEAVGYLDESLHYGMDWDLWCKFAKKFPHGIKYIPELLAANREYGDTKTSYGGKERLKEITLINERYRTGRINKAALLYRAAEFHKTSKLPIRIKDKLVASLARLVGASGKLKQMRLHGFISRSNYIERKATIYQPLINLSPERLVLELENPGKSSQRVKIYLDQIPVDIIMFKSREKRKRIYKLNDSTKSDLLEIGFSCQNTFSKHKVALKINRLKLT
jgi:glycosyltransferase involved in cell wall biosynthesis